MSDAKYDSTTNNLSLIFDIIETKTVSSITDSKLMVWIASLSSEYVKPFLQNSKAKTVIEKATFKMYIDAKTN
jgi:hypothetical protein